MPFSSSPSFEFSWRESYIPLHSLFERFLLDAEDDMTEFLWCPELPVRQTGSLLDLCKLRTF